MKTKFLPFLILIFALQYSVFSQTIIEKEVKKYSCKCENKTTVREYFEQLENQQNFIAQCEQDIEDKRKSLDLPIPRKISHFGLSPVSLVKPEFPKIAKELKLSGSVLVEVFTDEQGFVIYSKTLEGKAFFYRSAEKAACRSIFRPLVYCGKSVKGHYLIKYNFTMN